MVYTRQIRNSIGIRVQRKPYVDFSFKVPLRNEKEINWWLFTLRYWERLLSVPELRAIAVDKNLKKQLFERMILLCGSYYDSKDVDTEIEYQKKHKEFYFSSDEMLMFPADTYRSPFDNFGHRLHAEMAQSLMPYRGLTGYGELQESMVKFLTNYAEKQAKNIPNFDNWNEARRKKIGEVLKRIALSEITSSRENCFVVYDGLNRVQQNKARNVIHNVLENAQHALLWVEFSYEVISSKRGKGGVSLLSDITCEVIDQHFIPWRRFISFKEGRPIPSSKPISDRCVKRNIQFMKRVMSFNNFSNNLHSYRFESTKDSETRTRERQVLIPEHVCQLFEIIRRWKKNKPNRVSVEQQEFVEACVVTLLSTGFRQSELLGFKIEVMNGKEVLNLPRHAVKTPAGGRSQEMCATVKTALPIIQRWILNWKGSHSPFSKLQTFFLQNAAEIEHDPRYNAHDLRSTAIAYYSRFYPEDLNRVKSWSGHETIETTFNVYHKAERLFRYEKEEIQLFFKFIRDYYYTWKSDFDFNSIIDMVEGEEMMNDARNLKIKRYSPSL